MGAEEPLTFALLEAGVPPAAVEAAPLPIPASGDAGSFIVTMIVDRSPSVQFLPSDIFTGLVPVVCYL